VLAVTNATGSIQVSVTNPPGADVSFYRAIILP
jgi:hypothetical protein